MTISLVDTFPKSRWEELHDFIKKTHGENHVMKNQELFDWYYSPSEDCEIYNMLVGLKNNQVISILGYLPTKFIVNGHVINGAWTALWFTLPKERSGIGALLMKRLMELFPIVAGQGASSMNREIVEALGHDFQAIIPKLVGFIDAGEVRSFWQSSDGVAKNLMIPKQTNKQKEATSLALEFNWKEYSNIKFGTLRDSSYIRKKYISNPFLRYEIIQTGYERTPTIAIVRIIQTDLGFRVARIVEFFGPNISDYESQWEEALLEIVMLASNKNCSYIDFYSTSKEINSFLSKMGFYNDNKGALPSLLDPVDFERRSQNLEVFINPNLRVEEKISIQNFFVTRGDGDQDRPNATYEILRND